MSSKPSTSENTIQADVGAGDKTGIYYITICNLPFGSSWQELKDWLRQACTVDHIELFQTSTSGWIRLRGKDNFEKAWKHINSVDFKGRSIIASDKNRTESIKIKELVESSAHFKAERSSPVPRAPYFQNTPPAHYEPQPASTQYSTASYGQFYMHGYPQSSPGVTYSTGPVAMSTTYTTAPTTSLNHPRALVDPYAITDHWPPYSPGGVLGYAEHYRTNIGSVSLSPYESVQHSVPYCSRPGTSSYSDVYIDAAQLIGSNDYVPTEARKILITSLSQRASPEETSAWIQRKAGPYAGGISDIEIPPLDSKNRVKGHAYVIFKTTAAAHGAVRLLNKAVFHNRTISARFTIEGVAEDERASATIATHPSARQTKEARAGESKQLGTQDKEAELGTSQRRSKSKSEKEKNKAAEKKESKTVEKESKTRPVIADGSSRRRHDNRKA